MSRNARHLLVTVAGAAVFAMALSAPWAARADDTAKLPDPAERRLIDGAPSPASQLPAAPANGEMGFVFSDFTYAIYPDPGMKDACPTGWAKTIRETYLDTLPPAERKRLSLPENEKEYVRKWNAYASPNGKNFCSNYNQFPDRPPQAIVQSKFAYGLNLDDGKSKTDPYYCAQQTFTNPLGEKGVNNQLYRAMGCTRSYRNVDGGPGEIVVGYTNIIKTGEFTIVLLLRNVHSLVNDDNVQVILASSDETPVRSVQGDIVKNASYTVSKNPRWRQELHGHIVNGVLTTDSHDILLVRQHDRRTVDNRPGAGNNLEWDLQRGKLRLAFRPDGTLQGLLGGYEVPVDVQVNEIGGGRGTTNVAGIDCAQHYNMLNKLADGGRDPKTGKCTRVSTAYQVTAEPAFVFDRTPANIKAADAR